MYKNIIVPMALDHGIADKTIEIARTLLSEGGQITALHVYEAPQGSVGAYIDEGVVQNAFDRAKAKLDDRVASMPGVTAVIVKGHSGRTIIDTATSLKADCIVLGSHKPGLIDYLLGSTAARVVQHAPCAVHVARYPS
ncbi:universal stress protein [Loktanella sp. Alg231-35]|uniref:universal stress protein n=1 Tax=Loktanella sp. Alg231-35 TaxID=1922220 RepID=UPI000D55B8F9|nr:universal stress protein [Loktanella sp. Alg231-35]